jgi:hypothetical protein
MAELNQSANEPHDQTDQFEQAVESDPLARLNDALDQIASKDALIGEKNRLIRALLHEKAKLEIRCDGLKTELARQSRILAGFTLDKDQWGLPGDVALDEGVPLTTLRYWMYRKFVATKLFGDVERVNIGDVRRHVEQTEYKRRPPRQPKRPAKATN